MKYRKLAALLVCILFAQLLSACGVVAKSSSSQASAPSVLSQVETAREDKPVSLVIPAPSKANNMLDEAAEQKICVYLPADYETSDKEYPVIYYLPGFGNSYENAVTAFAKYLKALPDGDSAKDMIVVGVDGINSLGGTFYANSPVTGNNEDVVTKDIVAYMDANYRTIADASARGLVGHSMGGSGVISISMHAPGVFGYAYSMSPGLFDDNGFAQSLVDFYYVEDRISKYTDMSDEEARQAYLQYAPSLVWAMNFTFAYGSAFAYDETGKAPYIKLPEKGADGEYMHDEVWERYDGGFGNLPEKLEQYGDNLKALSGFKIDYGTRDDFAWIPEGCEYFSALLAAQGIPHELVPYDGDHESNVEERIGSEVIPFFARAFGA